MNQQLNPGTIKNPSVGVPTVKGPQLNERDILNDVLSTEKHLTEGYNIFNLEAGADRIHKVANGILFETHQAARETFNMMFKKGWYKLNSAKNQSLAGTKQQFTNYQSQFPYGGGTPLQ